MSLPAGMLGPESKSGLQPLVKVCPGLLRRGWGAEEVVAVSSEWTGGCTQKWAGTQIRRRPWSLSTTNNNFSVHTHTHTHKLCTVHCATANSYKRNPAIKKKNWLQPLIIQLVASKRCQTVKRTGLVLLLLLPPLPLLPSALWWCKSQTAGHHGEWVSLFAVQRARLSNRRRANIAPRSALHRCLNGHCAGREIRITMPMNILTYVHEHDCISL